MREVVPTIVVGLLLSVVAGCGADPQTSPQAEIGFGHVHVNPADGLFYDATHYGVFRLGV